MQKKIIDRTQQTRAHPTTRHTTYKMVGEQRNGWELNGFAHFPARWKHYAGSVGGSNIKPLGHITNAN
jgi:hypothetical protein